MKKTMKKGLLFLSLMSVLIFGVQSNAKAKFIGWTTRSTTDWADGQCAYRETCRVYYFFWIPGSEHCFTATIGCI